MKKNGNTNSNDSNIAPEILGNNNHDNTFTTNNNNTNEIIIGECDKIRNDLGQLGISIEDHNDNSIWSKK